MPIKHITKGAEPTCDASGANSRFEFAGASTALCLHGHLVFCVVHQVADRVFTVKAATFRVRCDGNWLIVVLPMAYSKDRAPAFWSAPNQDDLGNFFIRT